MSCFLRAASRWPSSARSIVLDHGLMVHVFILGLLEESRIEDFFLDKSVHFQRSADLACELLFA
jgi:hypothetical protein